jgi:hypothetical protein
MRRLERVFASALVLLALSSHAHAKPLRLDDAYVSQILEPALSLYFTGAARLIPGPAIEVASGIDGEKISTRYALTDLDVQTSGPTQTVTANIVSIDLKLPTHSFSLFPQGGTLQVITEDALGVIPKYTSMRWDSAAVEGIQDDQGRPVEISAGALENQMDVKLGPNGVLNAVARGSVANILVRTADVTLRIGSVGGSFDLGPLGGATAPKWDTIGAVASAKLLNEPKPRTTTLSLGRFTDDADGFLLHALAQMLLEGPLPAFVGAGEWQDVSLDVRGSEPFAARIARASSQAAIQPTGSDTATISLGLDIQGTIDNAPIDVSLAPTRIAYTISGERLPLRALARRLLSQFLVPETGKKPKTFAPEWPDAEALFADLLTPDERLNLDVLEVSGPAYGLQANGTVRPDAKVGEPPVVGSATVKITGLDELLSSPTVRSMVPPDQLAGFTIVQALGRLEKAPNGKSLRIYEFSISGPRMLLNGADLGLLLHQ